MEVAQWKPKIGFDIFESMTQLERDDLIEKLIIALKPFNKQEFINLISELSDKFPNLENYFKTIPQKLKSQDDLIDEELINEMYQKFKMRLPHRGLLKIYGYKQTMKLLRNQEQELVCQPAANIFRKLNLILKMMSDDFYDIQLLTFS